MRAFAPRDVTIAAMGFNAAVIFFTVGVYGALHSWLASHAVKRWVRQHGGAAAARWYRLAYNVFFTVLLMPLLGVPASLPDRLLYVIPAPWRYATFAVQLAGLALAADATLRTDLPAFLGLRPETQPENQQLVIRGAYRWVRHPMYSGSLIFIWLMPAMTLNTALFYAALTLYIVIGAHWEERKLLVEYGEAYAAYRQAVPMLIPNFRRKT